LEAWGLRVKAPDLERKVGESLEIQVMDSIIVVVAVRNVRSGAAQEGFAGISSQKL
jgi:hypothetical protein